MMSRVARFLVQTLDESAPTGLELLANQPEPVNERIDLMVTGDDSGWEGPACWPTREVKKFSSRARPSEKTSLQGEYREWSGAS